MGNCTCSEAIAVQSIVVQLIRSDGSPLTMTTPLEKCESCSVAIAIQLLDILTAIPIETKGQVRHG